MIIYGLKLDITELKEKDFDALCGFNEDSVSLVTGYSVGCYEPEMAVFGIELSNISTLFNPTVLRDIIAAGETLTGTHVTAVKNAMTKCGLEGTTEIYMFDETDD